MKILVNREKCAGHARCNATSPELFRLDDDGYIGIESFGGKPGEEEMARRGARACPERALKVVYEPGDPGEPTKE
jgi:ferredoxin